MKFRTDYVTNSSSSSFILSLKFELTNNEEISWKGASDCGEGAYEYIELTAKKSPEELGTCKTIEGLIEMLKTSIGEDDYDFGINPIFDDESEIIKKLRNLSSINDIAKIIIEGYEDTFKDWEDGPEAFDDIVTYDMRTKKQTAIGIGNNYIECEGNGGHLDFSHDIKMKETPEGYFDEKRNDSAFCCGYEDEEDYD